MGIKKMPVQNSCTHRRVVLAMNHAMDNVRTLHQSKGRVDRKVEYVPRRFNSINNSLRIYMYPRMRVRGNYVAYLCTR